MLPCVSAQHESRTEWVLENTWCPSSKATTAVELTERYGAEAIGLILQHDQKKGYYSYSLKVFHYWNALTANLCQKSSWFLFVITIYAELTHWVSMSEDNDSLEKEEKMRAKDRRAKESTIRRKGKARNGGGGQIQFPGHLSSTGVSPGSRAMCCSHPAPYGSDKLWNPGVLVTSAASIRPCKLQSVQIDANLGVGVYTQCALNSMYNLAAHNQTEICESPVDKQILGHNHEQNSVMTGCPLLTFSSSGHTQSFPSLPI